MDRINVTVRDEETGAQRLVGWFDADVAEKFVEARKVFDGANLAGVHLRDQNRGQVLWLTKSGRWVLQQWSRWQGESDAWQFIGVDQAREWLALNGDDDVIERVFGEPLPPESGPGRPEIGRMVNVRMPKALIDAIDAEADRHSVSRAEAVRQFLVLGLATTPGGAPEHAHGIISDPD